MRTDNPLAPAHPKPMRGVPHRGFFWRSVPTASCLIAVVGLSITCCARADLPKDITHLFFHPLPLGPHDGLRALVHAAWDEGAPPLKVFGPNHWERSPTDTSDVTVCLNNDLRARTELPQSQQVWVARGGTLPRPWPAPEVTEITAGFTYQGDGWTLGSAEASHAQPILDCLGFSVEAGGKKFVYSGDTGINDDITALSRDADLLLHWCYRGAGEVLHPALQAFSPDPGEVADMAQSCWRKTALAQPFSHPHG